jgi:hypothetical protein
MPFEKLAKKLVVEAKKAAAAFAKAHRAAELSAFAFDASPYEEFFACCFDDGLGDSVGDFRHHLFHEFQLPVHAQLPKGGAPPWKGKDGYIEHHMRPVLALACETIASTGVLEKLRGPRALRIGYAYPGEALHVVATLPPAETKKRRVESKKQKPKPKPKCLLRDEIAAALERPDAFDALAYVFEREHMTDDDLWSDAFHVLLALAESPEKIDERWVDRAIGVLDVDGVRNSAIFVLGASEQPRAFDALHAAAQKEDDAKAATELAQRGDPRASALLLPKLLDRKWEKSAGWIIDALGKSGEPAAIPTIEKWIASRRNKNDPTIRFARTAIEALSRADAPGRKRQK